MPHFSTVMWMLSGIRNINLTLTTDLDREKMSVSNRRMQCEVRSMLNQGRVWGVYKHTRPKRCPQIWQEITRKPTAQAVLATEKVRFDRWMQCEARSTLNQGRVWGVYINTRPKRCPPIRQEIARNAPPPVRFFTKNKTITIY